MDDPYGPYYVVHGRIESLTGRGTISVEFGHTKYVEGPQDAVEIENLAKLVPDLDPASLHPDIVNAVKAHGLDVSASFDPDTIWYADLFYCHDCDVRLVGTWVVQAGEGDVPDALWHAGGWSERPRPPKDIRLMNSLDRRL